MALKLGVKNRLHQTHKQWEDQFGNYYSDGLTTAIDFFRKHGFSDETIFTLSKLSDRLADPNDLVKIEEELEKLI